MGCDFTFSCFLSPETKFIWSFIAPVTVILLTNIGFLIMAASVMWKHKKRQESGMTSDYVRSWLLALLSLAVVMGVTSTPSW